MFVVFPNFDLYTYYDKHDHFPTMSNCSNTHFHPSCAPLAGIFTIKKDSSPELFERPRVFRAVFFNCKWVLCQRSRGAMHFLPTFFAMEKSRSGFGADSSKTMLRRRLPFAVPLFLR